MIATSKVEVAALRQEAASQRLFAVLDPCDAPEVLGCVDRLAGRARCLFSGGAAKGLRDVAPHLVRLDEELLLWLSKSVWSSPWGVLLSADASIEEVRKHLRRFLKVEAPDGKEMFFRFYDPRLLPAFLAACNAAEVDEIFGPIESFYVSEGDSATRIMKGNGS